MKVNKKIMDQSNFINEYKLNKENLKKDSLKIDEIKEDIKKNIDKLCNDNSMMCGLVLTKDEILKLLETCITANRAISIKYNLYLTD